jgi:hypothetical protein
MLAAVTTARAELALAKLLGSANGDYRALAIKAMRRRPVGLAALLALAATDVKGDAA